VLERLVQLAKLNERGIDKVGSWCPSASHPPYKVSKIGMYVCTWLAGDGFPGLGGDLSTECITGGFLGRIAAEDMLLRVRVGVGKGDGLQEHCKEKSC
jgi:hypothetical protein